MADHEAAKIDKANHLLLDQPLLRLPYELLRNNFRSAHFTVEKESVAVKNALKESASAGLGGRTSSSASSTGNVTEDSLKSLDAMIARMRGVKRKLQTCADEEARLHHQVDARLAYLSELSGMQSLEDVAYERWSRRRLDRLLVDYLLRQGYEASATALVAADDVEGGAPGKGKAARGALRRLDASAVDDREGERPYLLRDLVDLDTFASMSHIRTRLVRDHSVAEALAWCVDNKKELRKMESKLEFMLRYQQYIEMVRTQSPQRMLDAIAHARKYLFPFHTAHPVECNQAAVLLCYPPGEEAPTTEADGSTNGTNGVNGGGVSDANDYYYSNVWGPHRWLMLADLFTSTHNQLLSLPSVPLLHLALSTGLSALKTPACHSLATATSTLPPLSTIANGLIDLPAPTASPSAWRSGSGVQASDMLLNGLGHTRMHSRSQSRGGISAAAVAASAAAASASAAGESGLPKPASANTNGFATTSGKMGDTASYQIGASVCPICSPELNELAKSVPYAHHSKSHLEHDLVQLPNGRVYGRQRLEECARKAGLSPGTVKDLRTGDVYPVDRLLKIFIT